MIEINTVSNVGTQKNAEAIQNLLTHIYNEMCQCGLTEAAHFVDCARQSLIDMVYADNFIGNVIPS